VRALAYPLAVLVVAGACFGAVALLVGARRWAAWVRGVGGTAGLVGLALTAVAAGNLLVPRTCAEQETAAGTVALVNRPILSAAVDEGACRRAGLAQVQVVLLAAVVTSGVVLARPAGATR